MPLVCQAGNRVGLEEGTQRNQVVRMSPVPDYASRPGQVRIRLCGFGIALGGVVDQILVRVGFDELVSSKANRAAQASHTPAGNRRLLVRLSGR